MDDPNGTTLGSRSESLHQAQQMIEALRDEQRPWLEELVGLGIEALLDCRIEELLDLDVVLDAVQAYSRVPLTTALIERHLKPAAARERQRAHDTGERVEAWWPPESAEELLRILRLPFPLDPEIINDLVDQGAVRSMLGSVLQEALVGFLSRSKLPGLQGAADLVTSLGRRAGKGILGGMGRGLEHGLERHVKEFLDQSMARITHKLTEIILDEPSQKLLGAMRADLMAKALKVPLSFYYDEAAKLPADDIWALLPPVIAHNLDRPEIREALANEVRELVRQDGQRTARDLLDELGVLEQAQDLARRVALPAARRIVASEAFSRWLAGLAALP